MRTYKRICIEDHQIIDGDRQVNLERGKEYTTTTAKSDGTVTVFSSPFWALGVPVTIFAGERVFTEK